MNRMPRRTPSRILVLLGACCALGVAIALPVVASAQGGGNGNADGSVRSARATKRICQAVGVSLDGRAYIHRGPAYGELTEAQVQVLQSACKALAAAYVEQRTADSGALTAEQEAITAARVKLEAVCPLPGRHHRHHHMFRADGSTGPTGATGATGPAGATGPTTECVEAEEAFWGAVKAARKTYREVTAPSRAKFGVALAEFERAVEPIVGSGFGHHHHHRWRTGPTGATGATGTTGTTGETGTTGVTETPNGAAWHERHGG